MSCRRAVQGRAHLDRAPHSVRNSRRTGCFNTCSRENQSSRSSKRKWRSLPLVPQVDRCSLNASSWADQCQREHPVLCGSLNVCCSHVVPCGLPPDGRLRSPCCSQTPAEHHAAACVGGRPPAKGVCRLALLLQHNPQAVVDVHDGGDDHGDRDGCARACWRRAAPVAAPPLARAGRAAALFSACLSLTHRCRPTSAQALATTMR